MPRTSRARLFLPTTAATATLAVSAATPAFAAPSPTPSGAVSPSSSTATSTALTARVTFAASSSAPAAVHGTATPGSTVIVALRSAPEVSAAAETGPDGVWSTELPPSGLGGAAAYDVYETAGDELLDLTSVTADFGPGVVVLSPATGTAHAGGRLTFTGTGEPGSRIYLSRDVAALGAAVVRADGGWSITATIPSQDQTYRIRQVGKGANVTTQDISIRAGAEQAPLVVTAPAAGSTVVAPRGRVTFRGTGPVGATLRLGERGTDLGSATVAPDCGWSATVVLGNGTHAVAVTVTPTGGPSATTERVVRVVGASGIVSPA